ncbi:phosphoribosylformylglycinamidine synthase subunit PurS [Candidatus Micrarchaeota archaeon]|nr:phosphoribosylformylglycinamidine synthase subunit PurS [Candidatus Micrarchaeota archaeon]
MLADNKKDAKDKIKSLSEDVLSNPIIDDFEILTVENTDK